jgi:hypothetical protein
MSLVGEKKAPFSATSRRSDESRTHVLPPNSIYCSLFISPIDREISFWPELFEINLE